MRILSAIITVWSLMGIAIMRFAPIGPQQPQYWLLLFAPVFLLFAILAAMVGVRGRQKTSTNPAKDGLWICLAPLLCISVLATVSHNRDDYVTKLQLEFEGTVVEKFESRDHAALSLRIRTAAGDVLELEGILPKAWAGISVGDAVRKKGWSESAFAGGREFRLFVR